MSYNLSNVTTFCRTIRLSSFALAVLAVATVANAAPIPGLYNTGVGDDTLPLAAGSIDPHYTLIASDDPDYAGPNALVTNPTLPGTWIANSSTGQWISPNANQTQQDNDPEAPFGNAAGTYIYELKFDLTGLDSTQATITGAWAVDDIGLLMLNGVYVPLSTNLSGPGTFTSFTIPVGSSFVPGINKLDFIIVNGGDATGLHVERLSGDAPGIPEPPSVILGTLGGLALLAYGRRPLLKRRRKYELDYPIVG